MRNLHDKPVLMQLKLKSLEKCGKVAFNGWTAHTEPGTRNEEPGTRNKEQGTRNKKPGTRAYGL